MLILENLYLGDIRPNERSFKRNSQYAKALDDLVKSGDALTDTLIMTIGWRNQSRFRLISLPNLSFGSE